MSIVVEDYHKNYGNTVAVAGVSFTVAPGEILGLVGPNGAGKTTTLRALAGILTPTRGRLLIAGHDLARAPVAAKAALAYVPDEPRLFDQLTVWEHFRFVAAAYRLTPDWPARAGALLTRFELTEKRDVPTAELSRGMRQKVAVCCGYLHEPRAVLLDEPLTGLDPRGMRTLFEGVRRRADDGAAVIMSSHVLSQIERLCTRFLILRNGTRLLHGTKREIAEQLARRDDGASLEQLFFDATERGGAAPVQ